MKIPNSLVKSVALVCRLMSGASLVTVWFSVHHELYADALANTCLAFMLWHTANALYKNVKQKQ